MERGCHHHLSFVTELCHQLAGINQLEHSSEIVQSDLYLLSGLNYSDLSDRETNLLQQSYCGILSHRVFSYKWDSV